MTLEIITSVILFLCVLMTCIPTLPGVSLMFVVTLVYAFIDDFATLAPWQLGLFGGIALLSIIIDTFAGILGAKYGGASRKAVLAGMVGMVLGFFVFPPLGVFIGLFLGVFVAEALQYHDHRKALKAASSSLVATALGVLCNVALAIAFFITFLIFVF